MVVIIRGCIFSAIFLAVVSASATAGGGDIPDFVDRLALNRVGQFSHDIASQTAEATSNAAARVRNYVTNLQGGPDENGFFPFYFDKLLFNGLPGHRPLAGIPAISDGTDKVAAIPIPGDGPVVEDV